jgi:hypothetical protein
VDRAPFSGAVFGTALRSLGGGLCRFQGVTVVALVPVSHDSRTLFVHATPQVRRSELDTCGLLVHSLCRIVFVLHLRVWRPRRPCG